MENFDSIGDEDWNWQASHNFSIFDGADLVRKQNAEPQKYTFKLGPAPPFEHNQAENKPDNFTVSLFTRATVENIFKLAEAFGEPNAKLDQRKTVAQV